MSDRLGGCRVSFVDSVMIALSRGPVALRSTPPCQVEVIEMDTRNISQSRPCPRQRSTFGARRRITCARILGRSFRSFYDCMGLSLIPARDVPGNIRPPWRPLPPTQAPRLLTQHNNLDEHRRTIHHGSPARPARRLRPLSSLAEPARRAAPCRRRESASTGRDEFSTSIPPAKGTGYGEKDRGAPFGLSRLYSRGENGRGAPFGLSRTGPEKAAQ